MRAKWIFMAMALVATGTWADSPQATLEQLKQREGSPAFRRAIISYQAVREAYENAYQLPSVKPLVDLSEGYQALIESTADTDPQLAATAFDRALQIVFTLGEKPAAMEELRRFEVNHPRAAAKLQTLANLAPETTFGEGNVEVRALEVGQLQEEEVVAVAFEARSLSEQPESIAMDLRVMNDIRNFQSQCFIDVPAGSWTRHEITLGKMFAQVGTTFAYRVLPGDSVVRLTLGRVPPSYPGKEKGQGAFEMAFENQFCQRYYIRRP
ncbi:MAG: hypothetical protein IT369_16955 [Candidatus Latescibacteria bacterium]|nr:hypothetical protein [Candidatus Latescibacterota bacterium]